MMMAGKNAIYNWFSRYSRSKIFLLYLIHSVALGRNFEAPTPNLTLGFFFS